MPCIRLKINRRFIETFRLSQCLIQASFLVVLLYSLEDEFDIFLRNASSLATD
jgi:hypothetical protein